MSRTYEVMYIVRPDVEEEEIDKLIAGFEKNVTDGGGEIRSTEKMGRRRLAYTIRKFNDGFYVLMTVAAPGPLVSEIERRLRVSEQVIKFITVRIDEEEKRLAKIKAIRDTRVKRSATPPAPAEGEETAEETAAPAEAPADAPTEAPEAAAVAEAPEAPAAPESEAAA